MWNPASNGGEVRRKRRADESSLSSDQERFTKRFNLLNLGSSQLNGEHGNSNYYIPVSKLPSPQPFGPSTAQATATGSDDGLMQVDETRDRVYIHNLDEELAEESEDEKLIFLPDIERHFSKIPQHVLTGRKDGDNEHQELVLYNVPKSLSVDEGRDSVRKAIIEARQRARQKAAEDARHNDMVCKYDQGDHEATETAHGYGSGYAVELQSDPDAMEMD